MYSPNLGAMNSFLLDSELNVLEETKITLQKQY